MCDGAAVIDCDDIAYDVRPYASFNAVNFAPLPLDANGDPAGTQFTSGTADQVLAVRLITRHQFVTPYLDRAFAHAEAGDLLLEATIIVRGEPWQ